MDLTYEELDLLINKISLGKEILFIDGTFISLIYPSSDIKIKASLLHKQVYEESLDKGFLTKEALEKLILDRGIFSTEDSNKVDKLRSRLEAQKILLSKTLKVKANQDRIKNTIQELEKELSELLYKKYSKLYMSAETKADEESNRFICYSCTYKDSGERYWETYNDFIKDPNTDAKHNILNAYLTLLRGIDVTTIRYIARSTLWRIRYNNSIKTSDQLFGVPSTAYTLDQLNLAYWSNFYEQVYSMMPSDRPSDEVINDDTLLDGFMEDFYKDMNNEASILRERNVKSKGAMSAFDAEEVIVTQSNSLYFDIEYDKPKEAQKIKDRADIKKRTVGR